VTAGALLLHGWTFRPVMTAALALALIVHAATPRLRGPGRTAALLGAAAAVVVALMSPVDLLARGTLFSAHMLQHMLLVLAAPPLALLAIPRRRRVGRRRRIPVVACWGGGVGAMWIWHAPALCSAAATSDAVRALQTSSLLAMGTAFWWPILGPWLDARLGDATSVAYLFTACGACSVLGIALAFSPGEVCTAYLHPADPLGVLPLVRDRWGLTPAVDQQLGGLLMWVPGCAVYATAILAVVARFYGASAPVRTEEAR
jgi:cytochrome c oxidase assembly factor CtaG